MLSLLLISIGLGQFEWTEGGSPVRQGIHIDDRIHYSIIPLIVAIPTGTKIYNIITSLYI